MNKHEHSRLFRLATRVFKFFLLVLFGLAIVCLLAIVCGGLNVVSILFSSLWVWLGRIAVIVGCILLIGVVGESLR